MMDYTPVKKPSHKRNKPKRGKAGKFSNKTKKAIFERDDYKCVRCKTTTNLESTPHHVVYKSAMGLGTIDNGVCICRACHDLAHSSKAVRTWFEEYRTNNLLEGFK